jgi:hypothetical protein
MQNLEGANKGRRTIASCHVTCLHMSCTVHRLKILLLFSMLGAVLVALGSLLKRGCEQIC